MTLLKDLLEIRDFGHWMGDQGKKDDAPAAAPAPSAPAANKAEYDDSADFTNDMFEVRELFNKIEKIVHSDKWEKWMKITDQNFGTDCKSVNDGFVADLRTATAAYDDLLEELDKAQ